MKNTGLKGVTDAMAYCKSMYAKGGSAGKSQIIRSMKSFEMGGTPGVTMDSKCSPDDGGRCHKGSKKANRSRLKDAGVGRKTRNRMY
jgi:hypothetical protein